MWVEGNQKDWSRAKTPVGTIRERQAGRSRVRWIKVREDGPKKHHWMQWARWWWLTQRGPVPVGQRVVHLDGNTLNDDPDNIGCVSPGDLLFICHEADPTLTDRNRAACRQGTIEMNVRRGVARRRRQWLPTRWYAVFPERRTILNQPTRSLCDLLRLFGGAPPRNGRIEVELPFVAILGRDIEGRYSGFRRLPKPPAEIVKALRLLLPPLDSPVIAPNPSGLCLCGCGRITARAKSDSPDVSLGQHRRFVQGHYQHWLRKTVDPTRGSAVRTRCLRIAEQVARAATEKRWDEALGPAFEAALLAAKKNGKVADIRLAATAAVKRHFTGERTYGVTSIDYLTSVGREPST